MRFFLLTNVAEDLKVDGKRFAFDKTHFVLPTNSWWGVLKVSDEDAEILKKDKRVEEINEDDYRTYLSRRGDRLVTEFQLDSSLPAAPVVKPEVPTVAPVAEVADVLTPKKVTKK